MLPFEDECEEGEYEGEEGELDQLDDFIVDEASQSQQDNSGEDSEVQEEKIVVPVYTKDNN